MTDGLWAAAAAGLASAGITLRALMLNPRTPAWADAPVLVRAAMAITGATFGGVAVSLLHSERSSLREAIAYSVVAAASFALLFNMWRQRNQLCAPERS